MNEVRPQILTVPAELSGERLDRALVALVQGVSRARLQELIRDGGVKLEGAVATRLSARVAEGSSIEIATVPRSRMRTGGPPVDELEIVFEDEHLAVIVKPAGMATHPSSVVRGGTVSERIQDRFGPLPSLQGDDRPGIVHRLDADTSGLLVIARREESATELMRMFREREIEKEYHALVFGAPRFDTEWIDAPIGRAQGRGDRMGIAAEGEGKAASTYYETLERFKGFGFVRCLPKTGRTHQIRVHLASVEHPLLGDRIYRGRRGLSLHVPKEAPPMKRHALHASGLAFSHPIERTPLRFEAPLAADMDAWLSWLRARASAAGA